MTVLVSDVAGLARRAEELLARRGGARTILGIVGAPGSGKTTLANGLVTALAEAVAVPMDGFHLAEAELVRLGRRDRKGAPDTFDPAGYATLLERLRAGGGDVVYAPMFDRSLEEPVAGSIAVPPELPLVVTEGNYLLLDQGPWSRVRALLDEVWYVEADDELRQERLVARHVRHGKSPDAAREWVLRSDEANAVVVRATRSRADVVVSVSSDPSGEGPREVV